MVPWGAKETEGVSHHTKNPFLSRRKLAILNAAVELSNLKVPPGNHLEALTKDRNGQHSIRVNDQYRICFRWSEGNAHDVEVVDYH